MELFTRDFFYHLPEDRIALFPTENRDGSRLLVYQDKTITHEIFNHIDSYLDEGSLLVFNNSKVIPARLLFKKESGATIEIFLLSPADKAQSAHQLLYASHGSRWLCTIGNKKKWNKGITLRSEKNGVELRAEVVNEGESIVEFGWSEGKSWSEILQLFGDVPLPPYIKRSTNDSDKDRYQTVYSSTPGAVAAPTAGLHFTPEILGRLDSKGISKEFLTLHVSAGTFQPIKTDIATQHHMHEERVYFTKQNLEHLLMHADKIIPVGTTSCRSLESLYWYGTKLITSGPRNLEEFTIDQSYPYQFSSALPTRQQALSAILNRMDELKINELPGSTSIFIHPGYNFRMTDGLITNFHQPGSTLLLLIAALIGNDWKRIYESALHEGYRFLSYGDSSLLVPGGS